MLKYWDNGRVANSNGPKLDGLINLLSNDKNIADLQGKLYGEISKIEGLADEKII